MVAEMFALAQQKNVEKGLPGFRLQQWYFFFCAAFGMYGYLLKRNLLRELIDNEQLPSVIGARAGEGRPHGPWHAACGHNPRGRENMVPRRVATRSAPCATRAQRVLAVSARDVRRESGTRRLSCRTRHADCASAAQSTWSSTTPSSATACT